MSMLKTRTSNRSKAKQASKKTSTGDRVIIDGVVCDFDGLSGLLLIVPLETEADDVHGNAEVRTWDVLQGHPIAQKLETETQLALLCEFLDLYEDLQGTMSLAEFIDASIASDAAETDEVEPEAANDTTEPSDHGDGDSPEIERPASVVGLRIVYRFPGQHVLSDANGVTRDSGGTVAFTDVAGEVWSNVSQDKVYTIHPDN
jgi:hypothetical protein